MIMKSAEGNNLFLILAKAFILHIIRDITYPPGQRTRKLFEIFLKFKLLPYTQIWPEKDKILSAERSFLGLFKIFLTLCASGSAKDDSGSETLQKQRGRKREKKL